MKKFEESIVAGVLLIVVGVMLGLWGAETNNLDFQVLGAISVGSGFTKIIDARTIYKLERQLEETRRA